MFIFKISNLLQPSLTWTSGSSPPQKIKLFPKWKRVNILTHGHINPLIPGKIMEGSLHPAVLNEDSLMCHTVPVRGQVWTPAPELEASGQGPGLAQGPAQPWQCCITATGKELMQSKGHKNLSSRKQTSAHIGEEMLQKHLQPLLIFTIAGKY